MTYLTKYREEIHEMRDRGDDDDSYSDLGWLLFLFIKIGIFKIRKNIFCNNSIFLFNLIWVSKLKIK